MRALPALAALGALFLLSACDWFQSEPDIDPRWQDLADAPPSPALWEIEDDTGTVRGWLFGTIHALPDGVEWRTPLIENAIASADALMVEVDLGGRERDIGKAFQRLSATEGQPDLYSRVPAAAHADLRQLLEQAGRESDEFEQLETWGVALTLSNLVSVGKATNGVDRALIEEFEGRQVFGFERLEEQLGIFDSLPEPEQSDLLVATAIDYAARPDNPPLYLNWRAGKIDEKLLDETSALMADPELRAALLDDRNEAWAGLITLFMKQQKTYLIAVGAAHMVGESGLPARLRAEGFTVTRIQ